MIKYKRSRSPFMFLFFPNMDHYRIHDQHQDFIYSKNNYDSMTQRGIGRTMCQIQRLMSFIINKKSHMIIPRYRRKKNSKNLKINGVRSESDKQKYYGSITQLSLHISYHSSLRTMAWLYGSVIVYDKCKNKLRRTEFKSISYTNSRYDSLWHLN